MREIGELALVGQEVGVEGEVAALGRVRTVEQRVVLVDAELLPLVADPAAELVVLAEPLVEGDGVVQLLAPVTGACQQAAVQVVDLDLPLLQLLCAQVLQLPRLDARGLALQLAGRFCLVAARPLAEIT